MITNHPRPSTFPSAVFGARVSKRETSTRVPDELILPTFSVRLLGRIVVLVISDPKMTAVTRVMSWFMKKTKPFPAHDLQKILAHLGERDSRRIRTTIQELGGVLPKGAP